MELTTERLRLREFRSEDLADLAAYHAKSGYRRFYASLPEPGELVERFVAWSRASPRSRYQLAITLAGEDRVYGCCGVRKEHPDDGVAEFGCELDPALHGQGYATEASEAILAFGFAQLGLKEVHARCAAANGPALRLVERLGFTPFGREEDEILLVLRPPASADE